MDAVINRDLKKDLHIPIPHIAVNDCAYITKHMTNG